MKKLALALAAMMTVACFSTVSFAEETVTINWSDVEEIVEASGVKGSFVTLDEIAVKMWMPDDLKPMELTDEDKDAGFIAYYTNEEGDAAVSVVYADVNNMSLDEYFEYLEAADGVSDIEFGVLNGLECVTYEMKETDSASIAFATEAGYVLEVTLAPMSDEEFAPLASFITCSIMPEEATEAATEGVTEG